MKSQEKHEKTGALTIVSAPDEFKLLFSTAAKRLLSLQSYLPQMVAQIVLSVTF